MCTVQLPCHVLMNNPGTWRHQWCPARISEMDKTESQGTPFVLVEAMFAPSTPNESPRNLLRMTTFWVPATCAVCSAVLFGQKKGVRCEQCDLICCADCRLHVDVKIPCGSEASREIVSKSIRTKLSVQNIMSTVAPDQKFQTAKMEMEKQLEMSVHGEIISDPISTSTATIGRLNLLFVQACVYAQSLPPESDLGVVFDNLQSHELRPRDYYLRVSSLDGVKTQRTFTVQNTATPQFRPLHIRLDV